MRFINILSAISIHVTHPPMISVVISIAMLVFGSILSIWVARRRDSTAFAIVYLWLVKIGEAKF